MDKQTNFWEKHGKYLLALALILAVTSLVMNVVTRVLEQGKKPAEPEKPEFWLDKEETNVVNILAAGAVMPCKEDTDDVFAGLGQLVNNYEYAAVTYHSLVGTDSRTAFADEVCVQGFNMVGLAYPEVHAYGKDAIDTSMNYWNQSNARISGTHSSTDERNQLRIFEQNGISTVYLSFTDGLKDPLPENEAYLVNVYDDEKTPLFVNKAAEQADLVIVSIAWEGGQGSLPNDRQKQIAEALAGAGASVIIGYADNAVQPVCWIDDTLVFYSLGNLYSESEEVTDRIGALGAVTVTETIYGDRHRIELTNPKMDLVASVKDEDVHAKVILLDKATEEQVPSCKELYEGYVQTLQRMDDSIRIGGLK